MTITASDLQPFCLTKDREPHKHYDFGRPWSSGEYTFATNGWVMVRIPRLADVDERDGAPTHDQIGQIWNSAPTQKQFRPLPARLKLPADDQPETEQCWHCHGTGHLHPCPDCKCECTYCNGTGTVPNRGEPIRIFGTFFDARLVKTLSRLPELRFSAKPPKDGPACFTFSGGEGLVMPLRWPRSPTDSGADNGSN
jgi:hypothetical protein